MKNKKFSIGDLAVTGGMSAAGSGASILAVAGPVWLALTAAAFAGIVGIVLTNEIPKK